MADDNEQPSDRGTPEKNNHTPGLRDERNVKPSTRRERPLPRAEKKPQKGPNPFGLAFIVLFNVLIFAVLGYLIWDMIWDIE